MTDKCQCNPGTFGGKCCALPGKALSLPMPPVKEPCCKPAARFRRLRTLFLAGALLPGIGCYSCLFYTFIFQFDRVQNFATTNCPSVKSSFPPVSYSIGVWQPQNSFWLFVMFLHVPARLFFGIVYYQFVSISQSFDFKTRGWYNSLTKVHVRLIWAEFFGWCYVVTKKCQNGRYKKSAKTQ